ncbi:MAG: serine hydrolase [bacterium]|nr:serine hydrolase [bacterium]
MNRNITLVTFFLSFCFFLYFTSTGIDAASQTGKNPHQTKDTVIKRIDGSTITAKVLDSQLSGILKAAGLPGLSIAVINDSRIVYFKTFGVKNSQTKEPAEKNTLFEAASLTKPVLAYTALKLVSEGKLDLDKPLYKYYDYKDIAYDPRHTLITARIVLNHSSGLINLRWMNQDNKLDIKFTPGTQFGYSGEGYFYLQRTVEKIMGKPLEKIAQTKVFSPLKMNHSTLTIKDAKSCASGHRRLQPQKKSIWTTANAAFSLHTTAKDYARFVISILKNEGLPEKTIKEMLSPQISISKKDASLSRGLGWSLKTTDDDTYFWHWGDNRFFKAFSLASKNKRCGVVYFVNSASGHSIMKRVVNLTFGDTSPIFSQVDYLQYDGPAAVLGNIIMSQGLTAGLKKYDEWLVREPGAFIEGELNSLGYKLIENNKFKEAIVFFEKNVELFPKSANAYESLGKAYAQKGNKETAIKNYKKSLQLNPNNPNVVEILKKLTANH